ncbi:MAG: DUF2268 domain-containing protein [Chloroflexi bacterium]|nr:DUF2268 domain-containing protein [Chloroflexota bacterium]
MFKNAGLRWIALGLVVIMLGACGSEDVGTQSLVAVPTRTPAPQAEPAQDASTERVQIISLRDDLAAFLAQSGELPLLDQAFAFIKSVGAAPGECFGGPTRVDFGFQALFELSAVQWPITDFSTWQAAVEVFPEAELIEGVAAAVAPLADLLPAESTLTICLVPVPPAPDMPSLEPTTNAGWRMLPRAVAYNDLNVLALDGEHLLVTCSAGPDCLDDLPPQIARGLGFMYQQQVAGKALEQMVLLEQMIFEGRANELVRALYPDARFAWADILTAEQAQQHWSRIRSILDYGMFSLTSDFDVVYGYIGDDLRPAWGGMYLGDQIVRAYRARHPDVAWPELAALSVEAVLAGSGYDGEAVTGLPPS